MTPTAIPIMIVLLLAAGTAAAQQNAGINWKINPSLLVFDRETGHFELTDGSEVVGYKLRLPVGTGGQNVWFQPCTGPITTLPTSALRKTEKSCASEPTTPPLPLWGFTISSENPGGAPPIANANKLSLWTGQTHGNPVTTANKSSKTVECTELPPTLKAAFSSAKPIQQGTLLEQTTEGGVQVKTDFMAAHSAKVIEQYRPAELNACPSSTTLQAFPIANPGQFGLGSDVNLYAVFLEN